jgi:hypothetical protein
VHGFSLSGAAEPRREVKDAVVDDDDTDDAQLLSVRARACSAQAHVPKPLCFDRILRVFQQ